MSDSLTPSDQDHPDHHEFPVLSRETVRALDRICIERLAIPGIVLMENAGAGCSHLIAGGLATGASTEPVVILAGPGNNGGDGFVIGRHLYNRGVTVTVWLVGASTRLRPGSDAAINLLALRGTGVPFFEANRLSEALERALGEAGCVVDALFGTGLDRPLQGIFTPLFAAVRERGTPVFAVDIPSGLDAETGEILGTALAATETATFVAAKPGLLRREGPRLCGRITVVPISIPQHLLRAAGEDEAAFREWAEKELAES